MPLRPLPLAFRLACDRAPGLPVRQEAMTSAIPMPNPTALTSNFSSVANYPVSARQPNASSLFSNRFLLSRFLVPLIALLFGILSISAPAVSTAEPSRLFGSGAEQEFLPVEAAFPFSQRLDENALILQWQVTPGYYLYQDRIGVEAIDPGVDIGPLEFERTGVAKEDPYFGTMAVFYETIEVRVPIELAGPEKEARLKVTYQGCAEAGLCYPPETQEVLYVAGESADADGPGPAEPVAGSAVASTSWGSLETAGDLVAFLSRTEPIWVALAFFLLGLGLTFTPCVLPMIPIISAIVAGARQITTAQAFGLSLSYVLGMAITYAAAGVVTGLLGASFNIQMYLQSPWVLGVVAGLFVLFALAMFGVYDIQLPATLRDRLSQRSASLSGGRLASVFGIGALSALIVSPCVSAPLAGALVYIGTTEDALLGGLALFMLGLGMGVPLLIVGTGGKRFIPQSGPWLNMVKGAFGILMLAVAIWVLERLVAPALTVALWGILAVFTAIHLGAFDRTESGWARTRKASAITAFAVGLTMIIGALAGAQNPLQPLAPFSQTGTGQYAGEPGAAPEHAGFARFSDPDRLPALLASASGNGRPVMLDFYADWCISCKIMERGVFAKPAVQERLERLDLLQVDLTANNAAHQALLDEFGLFGPPAILFFDASGSEIKSLRVLGEMDLEQFSRHLDKVEQAISS